MHRRLAAIAATLIISLTAAAATSAAATPPPLTPVPKVNLTRYLGQWYQIAAIPAIYEARCAKNATARYTFAADGNVSVANNCVTARGSVNQVTGEARSDNPPANSMLSVSFINLFGLKFFPTTPNYVIIGLGRGYRWAVVASPDRQSAFILSRRATLTGSQIATTQSILTANGINPCRLQVTVQDGGASAPMPYCSAPASTG